ncbi:MAG: hypothetical protein HY699_15695 [Deltaproteobacteria bacterium]|nr:hypothetical protein [Deltaproteobacteria bacterium]
MVTRWLLALVGVGGLLVAIVNQVWAQACVGDCDGSGTVTVDELVRGVNIALGTQPLLNCPSFDRDSSNTVTVDELVAGVNNALVGCNPPIPGSARLTARVLNRTGAQATVTVHGVFAQSGFVGEGMASNYSVAGVSIPGACGSSCTCPGASCSTVCDTSTGSNLPRCDIQVDNLGPGIWTHDITVSATGQEQYRQSLLVSDPARRNNIEPDATRTYDWTVFKTVLTVNQSGDADDGTCDATCTLRTAIGRANATTSGQRPVLIRFDHAAAEFAGGLAQINVTNNTALAITAAETVIDGTNSEGDPSPVDGFAARTYRTVIRQDPANKTLELAADIRVQAANVTLRGLSVERVLPSSDTGLNLKDQNGIAFDAGSQGGRIITCRLDGGAAARTAAENQAAQGKDCVDAANTGGTASSPVTVEDTEARFCFDRGLKSQSGYVSVVRSWIHNNLRGGLLVQSPPPPPTPGAGIQGIIRAVDNLVEQSGVNQAQQVARASAAEMAVQGVLARLETDGNVLRNGADHGIHFAGSNSQGSIRRDYICGFNRTAGNNGKGILVEKAGGTANEVMIRETTIAYTDDNGLKIEGSIAANTGSSTDHGRNAFVHNGGFSAGVERTDRNFRNLTTDTPALARGNYWQRCYPSSNPNENTCSDTNVSNNDTNNTTGSFDKVDSHDAKPHAADQGTQQTAILDIDADGFAVTPTKAVQGGIVRIEGQGFNAIGGHTTTYDCSEATLKANNCTGLNGTCVEFLDSTSGTWQQADILGVTPTHLTVRSPINCSQPTTIRVRRKRLSGPEIPLGLPEMQTTFCTNP